MIITALTASATDRCLEDAEAITAEMAESRMEVGDYHTARLLICLTNAICTELGALRKTIENSSLCR